MRLQTSSTSSLSMSVNVALCGSIPRSVLVEEQQKEQLAPQPQGASSSSNGSATRLLISKTDLGAPSLTVLASRLHDGLAENNRCGSDGPTHSKNNKGLFFPGFLSGSNTMNTAPRESTNNIMRQVLSTERTTTTPLTHVFEAPAWAVPSKGEARLEPIGATIARQSSIDLSRKAYVLVGRSPHCDVQLMHGTSSRRHSMLFHHSNGSCYIVDCGSAHGTFVNGKRITPPSTCGTVVPHKVRRGAIIRFGGPGAPCFVLKSFSFRLKDLITTTTPSTIVDVVQDDDDEEPDQGELVRRNTRLNALGTSAAATVRGYLKEQQEHQTCSVPLDVMTAVTRKRSFDSLVTTVTLDDEDYAALEQQPMCKRIRCSSPPLSPEAPVRLVSPDLASITASKPRRVHFSSEQPQQFYPSLVTPEESLSAEEDN